MQARRNRRGPTSSPHPALRAAAALAPAALALGALGLAGCRSTAPDAGDDVLTDIDNDGTDAGDNSDDSVTITVPEGTADGTYYLARGRNSCGVSSFGPGHEVLDVLACP